MAVDLAESRAEAQGLRVVWSIPMSVMTHTELANQESGAGLWHTASSYCHTTLIPTNASGRQQVMAGRGAFLPVMEIRIDRSTTLLRPVPLLSTCIPQVLGGPMWKHSAKHAKKKKKSETYGKLY